MQPESLATIIIACGPGADSVIDTAKSIEHYCPEPHHVVFIDDCNCDGTYETIRKAKRPNWHILRNKKRNGFLHLVHTLCLGLKYIHANLPSRCVLKLDTDSLLIREGVISDALEYMQKNPKAGLFGVYREDYNKPRTFAAHKRQMDNAMSWWRPILGLKPSWTRLLQLAESKGYQRGENVTGGAYFISWPCLEAISQMRSLDVPYSYYNPVTQLSFSIIERIRNRALPYSWQGRLAEDVYFSMAAVAAGFKLGHFAAPQGPICIAHKGLPYPARELRNRGYKIVHSIDKGPNTGAADNEGRTAREVFSDIRKRERSDNIISAVR